MTTPSVVRPRPRRGLVLVIVGATVLVAVIAAGWTLGVRLFVVESPSMGRAAPVGSLVVGVPVEPDGVHVGDVVTYRAPDANATAYTHRVVAAVDGGFRTRGDINGSADPWVVAPSMIVTRAAVVVPGLGWLVRALPLLVPAIALVLLLTGLLRSASLRVGCRLLGVSLAIAGTAYLLRPFAGFVLLQSIAADGGMRSTVVSTGLLPIRVIAADGGAVSLASGEVGRLLLRPDAHGLVSLRSTLDLDPLGWCLLGTVCLLPLLRVLVLGIPQETADAAR